MSRSSKSRLTKDELITGLKRAAEHAREPGNRTREDRAAFFISFLSGWFRQDDPALADEIMSVLRSDVQTSAQTDAAPSAAA